MSQTQSPQPAPAPLSHDVPDHIPRTSLATRGRAVGEVTVQFRRFTPVGLTAYQKGQYAGFMAAQAAEIVASGAAVMVQMEPAPGAPAVNKRMVTK